MFRWNRRDAGLQSRPAVGTIGHIDGGISARRVWNGRGQQ